jgi:hypothetical protein
MLNDTKLEYDFNVQFYTAPTEVEIGSDTNSLVVVNLGATIATVNNFPLNPTLVPGAAGESFVMGGNRLEVLKRKTLDIGFAAGVGRVGVIQKFYVNLNK